jgi:hypothetical protein
MRGLPAASRYVVVSAALVGLLGAALPAGAAPTPQSVVVNPVPAAGTPNLNGGLVDALAKVGDKIILGGDFPSASPSNDDSTVITQPDTMAIDAATGAIDTSGYRPALNGKVETVAAGPKPHEVYLGGIFSTVNGKTMHLALLDTDTGQLTPKWNPAGLNGDVQKVLLVGGRLYVGGTFTIAGGVPHAGLVALHPNSGKLTSYVSLDFTGHHNYRRHCDPSKKTCAEAPPGVRSMAVTPDGQRMVVIGNFTSVAGSKRDQIAFLKLAASGAHLEKDWSTKSYTAACFDNAVDSYLRDVQFAPDGSYFVVVSTGGIGTNNDGTKGQCDSAARYNTAKTGDNVRPTWVDYTGEDTLWSVAVTRSAIYVGGHQRWLNNSHGENVAAAGAVPRPGLAALSPTNGLPLAWNPGRNPRGGGAYTLLVTGAGLWVGSDTNYIGDRQYLRREIAFFPAEGGTPPATEATPKLPGRIFLIGATAASAADPDRQAFREFDGRHAGTLRKQSSGISWGSVRGAFDVDGMLIYGAADGMLHERRFDGSDVSGDTTLDPYDDPAWANVQTGSGQTYRGVPSTFSAEVPSLTSMFFSRGRLYYTVAGDPSMHWRWFEPDSGIVGADEHTPSDGHDWSGVAGAFLAGKRLFYADQATGNLLSVKWAQHKAQGSPSIVDASTGWASRGLLLLSSSTNPTATPDAQFTTSCHKAKCSFAAKPWSDPDGGVTRYRWAFGDGTRTKPSRHRDVTHRYAANGDFHVTLTVSTTSGTSAATTSPAHVDVPVRRASFVAATETHGTATALSARVPKHAKPHDTALLLVAFDAKHALAKPPAGWTKVGFGAYHGLGTAIYRKRVHRHLAGAHVTVPLGHRAHATALVVDYRNISTRAIERSKVGFDNGGRSHIAPIVRGLTAGSIGIGFFAQLTSGRPVWKLPHLAHRRTVGSPGTPAIGGGFADTRKPVSGSFAPGTARTKPSVATTAQWTIALSPALR